MFFGFLNQQQYESNPQVGVNPSGIHTMTVTSPSSNPGKGRLSDGGSIQAVIKPCLIGLYRGWKIPIGMIINPNKDPY